MKEVRKPKIIWKSTRLLAEILQWLKERRIQTISLHLQFRFEQNSCQNLATIAMPIKYHKCPFSPRTHKTSQNQSTCKQLCRNKTIFTTHLMMIGHLWLLCEKVLRTLIFLGVGIDLNCSYVVLYVCYLGNTFCLVMDTF